MTSLQLELYSFLTQYYRQIHPQPTTVTSTATPTAPSSSSSSSSTSLSNSSNHFIQDELKHLIENEFSCVDSIDSEQKTPTTNSPMKSPLQQPSSSITTPQSITNNKKRINKEIQMLSTSSATYYHSHNNLNNNTNTNNNSIPSEIKFKSFLHSNNLLLQLRKLSNHPYLILTHLMNPQRSLSSSSSSSSIYEIDENELFDQYLIESCGKLQMLDALLTTLLANNINKTKEKPNKILIYSQMTTTLDLLESYLLNKQIEYLRLDGETNKLSRDQFLFDFHHNEKICVFLLSTRAGGIGINLQIANTVILYDTDWNPMQDEQAIARVHRLGQHSTVLILRLLSQGPQIDVPSVEEYMLYTAQKKRTTEKTILSNQLFAGNLSDYSDNNNNPSSAVLASNNSEISSLNASYSFPSEQTAIPLEIDSQNQYLQTIIDRSFSFETNIMHSKNPIPITCYRIQLPETTSSSSTHPSATSSLVEAWKEYLNRMQNILQPSLLSQITDENKPSPQRITRQLQRKVYSQNYNLLSDKNLGLNEEENKKEDTLEIEEGDEENEYDDSFLLPKKKKKRNLPNTTKDTIIANPPESDSDSDYQLEAEEDDDNNDKNDNKDRKRKKKKSTGMKTMNTSKEILEIHEEDICVLCQHPWISSQEIESFCQLHQWDSSNPKYHDKDWLSTMIICDACEGGYHLLCVGIDEIPSQDWYCSLCQRIQHHSQTFDLYPELLSLSED